MLEDIYFRKEKKQNFIRMHFMYALVISIHFMLFKLDGWVDLKIIQVNMKQCTLSWEVFYGFLIEKKD